SQTGPYVARSGGFGFSGQICFGEASEQRSSDIKGSAKIAGPVLPGAPFALCCCGKAQSRALEILAAWRREGPDRKEKLLIQSDLGLGLAAGFGGFKATAWA